MDLFTLIHLTCPSPELDYIYISFAEWKLDHLKRTDVEQVRILCIIISLAQNISHFCFYSVFCTEPVKVNLIKE